MKKLISYQRAVQVSLILFGLFALMHVGIIIGIVAFDIVPLDYLWGGQMKTKEELLSFEIISVAVQLICLLVVLVASERIYKPKLIRTARVILWVLGVLFLLNTIANLFAKTIFEKGLSSVTLLLAFLVIRIALEKKKSSV